ncbi:MAG TPA: GNAT family N-acetyltransferase [Bryobacteraceae bacterium]|nr:GNAT family N-acetyltransferase [Bryobacteraceae bacterium]
MPDSIVLRAAIPADVPQILRFIQGLAEYEKLSHACQATEEGLLATLFGPRPFAEVLLAEVEGAAVGFALYFYNYSTFRAKPGIYLEDLYVLPERRGSGVGKALLQELARVAVQRGCARLEWSVLDWNEPAIAFYRSLGAEPQEEWTTYRLTDAALTRLAQ